MRAPDEDGGEPEGVGDGQIGVGVGRYLPPAVTGFDTSTFGHQFPKPGVWFVDARRFGAKPIAQPHPEASLDLLAVGAIAVGHRRAGTNPHERAQRGACIGIQRPIAHAGGKACRRLVVERKHLPKTASGDLRVAKELALLEFALHVHDAIELAAAYWPTGCPAGRFQANSPVEYGSKDVEGDEFGRLGHGASWRRAGHRRKTAMFLGDAQRRGKSAAKGGRAEGFSARSRLDPRGRAALRAKQPRGCSSAAPWLRALRVRDHAEDHARC